MDGRTNRPSFRDAYLLDALKKKKKKKKRGRERGREEEIFFSHTPTKWGGVRGGKAALWDKFFFPPKRKTS